MHFLGGRICLSLSHISVNTCAIIVRDTKAGCAQIPLVNLRERNEVLVKTALSRI